MMKYVNNLLAALSVLAILATSIWAVAGAINTANSADAKATEARQIAAELAKKIDGIDVIEERIVNLKKEIDEIQSHQVTTKEEQSRKLDKILEKLGE